ncbi:hypothetical protein [Pectinatus frisingensis]|nr:hypothetical protein [Pectinatus frisingensis]
MDYIIIAGAFFVAGFLLGTKYGGKLYAKAIDSIKNMPNAG